MKFNIRMRLTHAQVSNPEGFYMLQLILWSVTITEFYMGVFWD